MTRTNDRAFHALTPEEALAVLESSSQGLDPADAAERLAERGPNELPKEPEPSRFWLFLKQFHNTLNYILLGAAAISWLTGHGFDAAAIVFVVVLNSVIGYIQERKAERAIARLRDLSVPMAVVRRGGQVVRLPSRELAVGDVVLLTEGARVPADLRLLEAIDVRADQSMLTGESVPAAKSAASVPETAPLADRASMLYMGTLMTGGEAVGVVVEVASGTEFGRIASALQAITRERTPFEKRLDGLGRTLGLVAIAASAVIFGAGVLRGAPVVETFIFAVAAAVASIPEGLPFVLVIVLSVGVQRMARRNAVTRHLPAVETLGLVDVICSDKTGTLTENKMTVREIGLLDHAIKVSGEGWSSKGDFEIDGEKVHIAEHPVLSQLLRVAALCNRAGIEEQDGRLVAIGDPTEAALVVLGRKGGFERAELLRAERTLDEIPFSSDRKYRAILHEYAAPNGRLKREIMIIGALEALLPRSGMTLVEKGPEVLSPELAARFEALNEGMASQALRVLAVAVREVDGTKSELLEEDLRGLSLLGLVGMIDPPRPGIRETLERCRRAGIRVIMNTGDHKATAVAIAREIGLLADGEDADGRVWTDGQVAGMSDERLDEVLARAVIFARVSPQTKLRVVRRLKALGRTVAVTGDGINDAPALKSADVGVAMGIAGSDVTKEVADMVLTDDNFVSIVNAVEEGRIVFRNVKQTTGFLVMTNAGEIATILLTMAIGMPLPLLPAQVLWLNVVTDALTDEALALEPRHGDELKHPPRAKDSRILTRNLMLLTALTATLMAVGTILMFRWAIPHEGLDRARTVAFLSMSMFQLWNIFGMRSAKESIFRLGFFSNLWVVGTVTLSFGLMAMIMYAPVFHQAFRFEPLGWQEWAVALLVSSSVLWLVEGYKFLVRRGIIPVSWL